MIVRAFALGSAVGLVLALAASCGPEPRARCMPSNCNGCCDGDGVCRSGEEVEACGVLGTTCETCAAGRLCVDGSCRGAVASDGGEDGGTGNPQDAGTCSPSNCTEGCCDSTNHCNTSQSAANCGLGGGVCAQCTTGQTCQAGMCQSQCDGCFDAAGTCITGNLDTACGTGGNLCAACNAGQVCTSGVCENTSCSASNCTGCCDGTHCITSATDAQCGTGGQACVSCQGGQSCQSGTCQGGDPGDGGFTFPDGGFSLCQNCTSGCCDILSGTCVDYANQDPITACGTGGALCTSCMFQGLFSCTMGVCH